MRPLGPEEGRDYRLESFAYVGDVRVVWRSVCLVPGCRYQSWRRPGPRIPRRAFHEHWRVKHGPMAPGDGGLRWPGTGRW